MSYDTVVAADNPTAWWKLADNAGSTSAADSASGGAHPLTSITAVTFGTTGTPAGIAPNTCGTFNGTTSDASETSYDGPSSGAFSVEIWANCNNLTEGNFATFISQGDPGGSSHGWILQNDFGEIQFGLGTGTSVVNVAGGSMPANGWFYVVGTYDGTATATLYVNGTSVATGSAAAFAAAAGQGVHVGNHDGTGSFFNGLICEAAVYSVALTSTQVASHHTAGITPSGTTATGSLALAPMAMSGSQVPPVTTAGGLALAPMAFTASGTEIPATTTAGGLALAPMAMTGQAVPFTCTGGLALPPMGMSGISARPDIRPAVTVTPVNPMTVAIAPAG